MIEHCIQTIIRDLGPTGLLIIGLYFVLSRPLSCMAASLKVINHELGEILLMLKVLNACKKEK